MRSFAEFSCHREKISAIGARVNARKKLRSRRNADS
jgi:hypothetical protein